MLLFGKLADETQISKPQDHTETFKQNLTCIFLSIRLKLLVTFHYEIPCIYIGSLILLPAKKHDSSPNLGLMGEHHGAEA